jgi:hypothetical protein
MATGPQGPIGGFLDHDGRAVLQLLERLRFDALERHSRRDHPVRNQALMTLRE